VPECPPPSDLDEPYEAESPIKTFFDVSFRDTDDDEADHPPATGLGAVASIEVDKSSGAKRHSRGQA
jgi:hypothetical protein